VNILVGHSKQKLYVYVSYRSPDSSKTVDKKEILRTVSNTGIYCSSDKVGTVCLV
jgi:predicted transport protein